MRMYMELKEKNILIWLKYSYFHISFRILQYLNLKKKKNLGSLVALLLG